MEWFIYGLLFMVALPMSASAVYAFAWASRTGQLRNLDEQAVSIFGAGEPLGVRTDFFPGKAPRGAESGKPAVDQHS